MGKSQTRERIADLPPVSVDTAPPASDWAIGLSSLFVLILIAFAPLGRAGFVSMDDPGTISRNPLLNPPTLATLSHYWTTPARGLYAPIAYTAWATLAVVARDGNPRNAQLDPLVFHVANIVVHTMTCALVLGLLLRLSNRMPQIDGRIRLTSALFGTAVFAVHPLQVEPVAWVSGMKDLLAGLFGVGALALYFHKDTRRVRVGATMCLLLALLSKPSAMTVPVIALVLDVWMERRRLKESLQRLWPWFAFAAAFALLAWLVQPATRAQSAPMWARPLIVGDSLAFYLWKLIWPVDLAVCYGRTPAEAMAGQWIYIVWLIPLGLLGAAWWKRRTAPALLAAVLVFCVAPAPVLGLVRFDYQYFSTTADHYQYLALLGPAMLVAWFVRRTGTHRPVVVVAGVVVVALAVLSNRQSRTWRDDRALFSHSIAAAPRGVLALHNLANHYEASGERDQAIGLYRRALEVKPEHFQSMGALAGTLARMGREDEAVLWFERFVEAEARLPLDLRPTQYPDHLFAFAQTLSRRGDHARAARYFERVLALRPDDAVAKRDLEQARRLAATSAPATRGSE